jgi:predicted nucleic acid-binding protein
MVMADSNFAIYAFSDAGKKSKVADICAVAGRVLPIEESDNDEAIRIAERHQLSFDDGLMLAVALKGGAQTIYSEDLRHGLLVDDTLRIVDPFR